MNNKKNVGNDKTENENEGQKWQTEIKKYISLAIGFGMFSCMFLNMIAGFLIYDSVDKTEKIINGQIEEISQELDLIAKATNNIAEMSENSTSVLDDVGSSIVNISEGLDDTADSLDSLKSAVSPLSSLIDLDELINGIDDASIEYRAASEKLKDSALAIDKKKTGMGEFEDAVKMINNKVYEQKNKIDGNKREVKKIFGNIKLVVLISVGTFSMLFLAVGIVSILQVFG